MDPWGIPVVMPSSSRSTSIDFIDNCIPFSKWLFIKSFPSLRTPMQSMLLTWMPWCTAPTVLVRILDQWRLELHDCLYPLHLWLLMTFYYWNCRVNWKSRSTKPPPDTCCCMEHKYELWDGKRIRLWKQQRWECWGWSTMWHKRGMRGATEFEKYWQLKTSHRNERETIQFARYGHILKMCEGE